MEYENNNCIKSSIMKRQMNSKLILLGTEGVGKTSIVLKYLNESIKYVSPTIGASFFRINMNVEDVNLSLEVWDTAGQERFRSMAPLYYRNTKGALLVFDVTSQKSFNQVSEYALELQKRSLEAVAMTILGNKIDLEDQRVVDEHQAKKLSESLGANYIETSVKTNRGIEEAFLSIGLAMIHNIAPPLESSSEVQRIDAFNANVMLNEKPPLNYRCC